MTSGTVDCLSKTTPITDTRKSTHRHPLPQLTPTHTHAQRGAHTLVNFINNLSCFEKVKRHKDQTNLAHVVVLFVFCMG